MAILSGAIQRLSMAYKLRLMGRPRIFVSNPLTESRNFELGKRVERSNVLRHNFAKVLEM